MRRNKDIKKILIVNKNTYCIIDRSALKWKHKIWHDKFSLKSVMMGMRPLPNPQSPADHAVGFWFLLKKRSLLQAL
jgi:hypothetical protein